MQFVSAYRQAGMEDDLEAQVLSYVQNSLYHGDYNRCVHGWMNSPQFAVKNQIQGELYDLYGYSHRAYV